MSELDKKDRYVPMRGRIGYAMGGAAQTTTVMVISVMLTFYYSDILGINIAKVATIMMISRFLDGGSDIVAGVILDRTKSKYGKARPWILRMLIPHFIGLIAMFTVPQTTENLQLVYIFITYNFANTIVNTMVGLSLTSLNSLMTRSEKERSVLNGYREVGAPIMELLINSFAIPLASAFGGDQKAYVTVMVIISTIATLCYLFCFLWTKEVPGAERGAAEEKLPLKESFLSVVKNKYWVMMVVVWILIIFYWTITPGIIPYYCEYIMGNVNLLSYINMADKLAFIGTAVAALIWILPRFSKKTVMVMGAVVMILGQSLVFINMESMTVAVIAAVFRGIGGSLSIVVLFAMIADCVEYSHWKFHIRAEGVIFCAATVGQKFGQGVSSAIMGWLLDGAGYDGTLDVQPESANNMIIALYALVPIISYLIILVIMKFHHLDRELPGIMKELERRKAEGEN